MSFVAEGSNEQSRVLQELYSLENANVQTLIQTGKETDRMQLRVDDGLAALSTMDYWLDMYNKKLQTIRTNIQHIELKNNRTQVQTKNQRRLLKYLEELITELSFSYEDEMYLKTGAFDTTEGILRAEQSTEKLSLLLDFLDRYPELESLGAVKERMKYSQTLASVFADRLTDYLKDMFIALPEIVQKEKSQEKTTSSSNFLQLRIDSASYRDSLLRFSKLTMWLSKYHPRSLQGLRNMYSILVSKYYRKSLDYFLDFAVDWYRRKDSKDRDKYQFSTSYSNTLSKLPISMDVRKLKHKLLRRGKEGNDFPTESSKLSASMGVDVEKSESEESDAVSIENTEASSEFSSKRSSVDVDKSMAATILSSKKQLEFTFHSKQLMSHIFTSIYQFYQREYDFISAFFHLKNIEGQSDKVFRSLMATNDMLDIIFEDWDKDIVATGEFMMKDDPLSFMNMLLVMDSILIGDESDMRKMSLVTNTYDTLKNMANDRLERYFDEQLNAIKNTKLSGKKQPVLLPYVSTFVRFLVQVRAFKRGTLLETASLLDGGPSSLLRSRIEGGCCVLLSAILDNMRSLLEGTGSEDEKDASALDVLILENTHYLNVQLTKDMRNAFPGLDKLLGDLNSLSMQSQQAFLDTLTKRFFDSLVQFFDEVERLSLSKTSTEIGYHLAYNKSTLKKLLDEFNLKNVRKHLQDIHSRIRKHFEESDIQFCESLWQQFQQDFLSRINRYSDLLALTSPENRFSFSFSESDFKDICDQISKDLRRK